VCGHILHLVKQCPRLLYRYDAIVYFLVYSMHEYVIVYLDVKFIDADGASKKLCAGFCSWRYTEI
jgi:hypothetical protein